ncbi:hypothetical protein NQZ68_012580 [Dissostichus eleginoides]|nr:hypothetical protein NQZ68_012580 [Dissostichus eleginoides]
MGSIDEQGPGSESTFTGVSLHKQPVIRQGKHLGTNGPSVGVIRHILKEPLSLGYHIIGFFSIIQMEDFDNFVKNVGYTHRTIDGAPQYLLQKEIKLASLRTKGEF